MSEVHDIPVAPSMDLLQAILSRLSNVIVREQFQVHLYIHEWCLCRWRSSPMAVSHRCVETDQWVLIHGWKSPGSGFPLRIDCLSKYFSLWTTVFYMWDIHEHNFRWFFSQKKGKCMILIYEIAPRKCFFYKIYWSRSQYSSSLKVLID